MTESDAGHADSRALEALLSVRDVGDVLRISESGVYRLVRRGELIPVKVGGRTLFEPAVIRAFITLRRCVPRSNLPKTGERIPSQAPQQEAA
jgi:excisionase family DNA binding protein